MTTQATFRCITITAGDGKREQDQESGRWRRQYVVRLKSDATGAHRRFTYHDSIANEDAGKRGLAGDDLLYAFQAFVSDAQAGEAAFGEFCGDFGYDSDSMTAHRTWTACKDARKRLQALFVSDVEPADILEELAEMGIQ